MRLLNRLGLLVAAILFIACGEDRTYEYYKLTEENQWIFSQMQSNYFWGDTMKQPARNKFFASGSSFFESLLKKGDKTSFFCDSTFRTSYGITFSIVRDPLAIKASKSYAAVLFVEPGSSADKAGVKRGMWISRIGKSDVTANNYGYLERGETTTVYTSEIVPDTIEGSFVWADGDTITLAAATTVEPTTLPLDTVYNIPDHKVGYMLCNKLENIEEITPILSRFSAEGITDLIVDLRYCNSGSLETAAHFASAIIPEAAGNIFCSLKHNEPNSSKDSDILFSTQPAALNLWRVYIITTSATRGTAEAFTAALRMTMGGERVQLVGTTSAGENMHTQSIESPFDFTINPAVAYIYTPDDAPLSSDGQTVDYEISELSLPVIHKLGDINETLLYSTLYLILNGTVPPTE